MGFEKFIIKCRKCGAENEKIECNMDSGRNYESGSYDYLEIKCTVCGEEETLV